jgi:hypothetical protein
MRHPIRAKAPSPFVAPLWPGLLSTRQDGQNVPGAPLRVPIPRQIPKQGGARDSWGRVNALPSPMPGQSIPGPMPLGTQGPSPEAEATSRLTSFAKGLGALGPHLIAAGAPTTDPSARGKYISQGALAFQKAVEKERQQRLVNLKYGREQEQLNRTQQAAEKAAKQMDATGRGDYANLIRANPAEWLKGTWKIKSTLAGRKDRDDWIAIPNVGAMHIPTREIISQFTEPVPTAPPATAPEAMPPATESPAADVSPYAPKPTTPSSLKARADLEKGIAQTAYNNALAVVEADEKRVVAGRSIENALTRFGNLLTKQEKQGGGTGGILRQVPGVIGAEAQIDPEIANMQAIADEITPHMRQGMPGAASDRDVAMFQGATVSPKKMLEVNRNVIRAKLAQLERDGEYTRTKRAWIDKYRTMEGFEAEWNDFTNANPIFADPGLAADYALNPNRIEYSAGWRRKMKDVKPFVPGKITIKRIDPKGGI